MRWPSDKHQSWYIVSNVVLQEENEMAEKYARVLAHGKRLSNEEVTHLLDEHAKNVQALKMRQEQERERLRRKLEAKKKQLGMTSTSEDDESLLPSLLRSSQSSQSVSQQSSDSGIGRSSADDMSDNAPDGDVRIFFSFGFVEITSFEFGYIYVSW